MQGIIERAETVTQRRADTARMIVAQVYGVDLQDMQSKKRSDPRTALARQIAMYLSHIVFRMSFAESGMAFGRDRSTACHALHHVEDMREDPELDRTLTQLETLLRTTAGEAA